MNEQEVANLFINMGLMIGGILLAIYQANKNAQKTIVAAQEVTRETTSNIQTKLDDYDARIIRAHDRYEELEKRFDMAQTTIKEQATKITQLEADARNAALTESNLRGQVVVLGQQVENGQREASLQHAREELLKSDLQRMQGEIDKLKSELYALSQSNDALAKDKAAAENRERVLIDHAKNLEARNAALMVEIDELKARIEKLLTPPTDIVTEGKTE